MTGGEQENNMEKSLGSDPAFPSHNKHHGLTKRELFAAMAMQGIVNHEMTYGIYNKPSTKEIWRTDHTAEIADYAVAMADALLAELERKR